MDTYKYVRADSIQQSVRIGVIPDYTIVTASTPTLAPSGSANLGAYTDSAIAIRLIGSTPGIYTVAPADQLKEENRALNYIAVQADIGIGVTTGSSRYLATSGTITVVKNNGVLYFTSATPIQMAKSLDVLGGVVGAPATMTLNIVDVH